jgi:hypothetical protein
MAHDRIIHLAPARLHGRPLQGVLGHRRVEVLQKDGQVLLTILRAHAPAAEDAAGEGRPEPELVAHLRDGHLGVGRRLDDQRALAVLLDGRIGLAQDALCGVFAAGDSLHSAKQRDEDHHLSVERADAHMSLPIIRS